MACADGAAGYPERAPYDRVIATVGVADLAPAWLAQAAPQARVVVPLDLRGTQLSAAFERAGPAGPWVSRSLAPCGFMRMRGSLAGPELVITLAPGLSLLVPDGTRPGAPGVADAGALAGLLAGPSVPHPTGVRAGPARVFWGGLGLWLAAHEPRSCRLNEERRPGDQGGLLTAAPLRGAGWQGTLGIADGGGLADPHRGPLGRGGIRAVRAAREPGDGRARDGRLRPAGRAARRGPGGAGPGLGPGGPARAFGPARGRLSQVHRRPRPGRRGPDPPRAR